MLLDTNLFKQTNKKSIKKNGKNAAKSEKVNQHRSVASIKY